MNIQTQISNVGTSAGPAFCIVGNTPYLAWKGAGADTGLYWSKASSAAPDSNGQYNWAPQSNVYGAASTDGPALGSYKGNLYMVWKGQPGDTALYFSTFNGTAWAPQQKMAGSSSCSPALVGTPNGLLLVWKGASDTKIFWSKSTDGKTWSPQQQLVLGTTIPGTSSTPSLTAQGTSVYMAYKGATGNEILWTTCSELATWSSQQLTDASFYASTGPAIVCDSNGVIWLAFQATGFIYYTSISVGDASKNQWSPAVRRYGVGTSDRPSLISSGGGAAGVAMAWKGSGTDQGIYYGPLVLSVPDSLTFVLPGTNVGQGSPSSFNINAQLVMDKNGNCTFSGTYNNEAILGQTWVITFILKDGAGHMLTFTTNGDTTGTQTWNIHATTNVVASNWPGIVISNPYLVGQSPGNSFYFRAADDITIGDIASWLLGELLTLGTAAVDTIEIIGSFLS